MTDSTLKRLEQATKKFLWEHPFFGCAFLHMRQQEDNNLPTAAVDGVYLYWNRAFVDSIDDPTLIFVMAHETMHIALRHGMRRSWRDPKVWNVACDYAINRELKAAAFKLWPKCLYDAKYDGMSEEEIYDALMKDPAMVAKIMAGGADPGGCGAVLDIPGEGDGTPGSSAKTVDQNWQIRIKQAAYQAAKAGGHVPDAVKRLIDELSNPVVDWRDVLSRFAGAAASEDSSWNRPNRRLVSQGIYMPSRSRTRIERALLLFDVSGSISQDELTADLSEAWGIMEDAGCAVVQWAAVDTRVTAHGEISSSDELPTLDIKGGGGTHFESAMAWAAQQDDIAFAVFFTDGATASWGSEPPFPVLWCGHGTRKTWEHYAATAPYGETIWRGP